MRIDLRAAVTVDSARAASGAFLDWWLAELRDVLPPAIRTALGAAFERWTVTVGGTVWPLRRAGQDAPAIAIDMNAPPSTTHELIARIEPAALATRIDILLPDEDVLVRRMRLPASAASHVRSVVRLQLDRLSAFPAADVEFDCRVVAGADQGEIDVEVGLVPRATLEAYESRLAGVGLTAGRFRFGAMRFRTTRPGWTNPEKLQAALGGAAILAWIAVFALAPGMRDSELTALAAQVADMRGPALRAAAARDEVNRRRASIEALAARRKASDPLDVLRALTLAVPEDTHLTTLTIDGAAVRFEAVGPDAARVLASLRRSGAFRKPAESAAHGAGAFAVDAVVAARLRESAP